jgi:hypothetical protein
MSEIKPQSPQGKLNAALVDEAQRVFDALSDRKLSPEEAKAVFSRCQVAVTAPEAVPIRNAIIALVDEFLSGNLSFEAFDVAYGKAFHGDLPPWGLSWADEEPLSEIDERLQWTTKDSPSEEDRAYGYISREEFREWLVEYRRRFK